MRRYFGTNAAPWDPSIDEQVETPAPRQSPAQASTVLLSLAKAPSEAARIGRLDAQHNSSSMDAGENFWNIPFRSAPSTTNARTRDYPEADARRSLNLYDPPHDPPIDHLRTSNPQAQSTRVSLTLVFPSYLRAIVQFIEPPRQ